MLETTDGRYFRTRRGVWWDLLYAEMVPEQRVIEHIVRVDVSIRWVEEEN